MFCVLYKFDVKPDHEDRFRRYWSTVTKYLYEHAGSLGSRLHRADTGVYIGYAQWPSRDVWEQPRDRSDADLQAYRQAMRACCEAVEVMYELEVTDDWLQREVWSG